MADEAKTPSVDVEGLRARHAAATPGPWKAGNVDACDRDAIFGDPNGAVMCPGLGRVLLRANPHFPYVDDLAAIAETHNALPALLDIAEAVKAWGAAMERRLHASNVGSNVEWIAMTEAESDARGAVAAIARALAGGGVRR